MKQILNQPAIKDDLVKIETIRSPVLAAKKINLSVLRLDTMHAVISGNKWFKLKYNLQQAREEGKTRIVSFGGAWSNHLVAMAYACKAAGLQSIGIIRGERPTILSDSLKEMDSLQMELHFISREMYHRKEQPGFLEQLKQQLGDNIFIIPEGGNNEAGIRGCEEIMSYVAPDNYSHLCCAVGTGTTLAGIINNAPPGQQVLGFAAIKNGHYLADKISSQINDAAQKKKWELLTSYHFGGFAKVNPHLIHFMNSFYRQFSIPLDFIYTGKMMYGIFNLIEQNYFPPNSNVLAVHTGGLQGNRSLPAGTLIF